MWKEHHLDGTKRWQIDIQNSAVRIVSNAEYNNVRLDYAIISEDETAVLLNEAILRTFKEGHDQITAWRNVTAREYHGRDDLLDKIPKAVNFSLVKLSEGGWVITNACNPVVHFVAYLLKASIKQIAEAEGTNPDAIEIVHGDCWHHLRNVWFGKVIEHLGTSLGDILADGEYPTGCGDILW